MASVTSLLGSLGIAQRGMSVSQRGISVTGHNIANVNTPGYSRQSQILVAERGLTLVSGTLGSGVEQIGVERAVDSFIERQMLIENGVLGSLDSETAALRQVDAVFNDQTGEGISTLLSKFYRAFSDVASAANPGQSGERAAVRGAATTLIDAIHSADRQLRDLQRSADREMLSSLVEINRAAEQIASLNVDIVRESATATPNDLLDQRDAIVRELATRIDIESFTQPNGSLVVLVANGAAIVEGGRHSSLVARQDVGNPFDPSFSNPYFSDGANEFEVTPDIQGGELGGLIRSRDNHIANAIRGLDELAFNLMATVNGQHQAGEPLNPTPPPASTGSFFADLTNVVDSAGDLTLHADILASTENIRAAGSGPPAAPGDVENARLIAKLADQAQATYVIGDSIGAPTGSVAASVIDLTASMLSGVGETIRGIEISRDHAAGIVENLELRREEVSGVSLDEEVTNLVRLQASFQANARVMSTVQGLLQELIDIL